jgi:uncharacterized protein (DUF3084 family)
MKLSSASDTLDKANISKQEVIDRDTLIHQSLQTQINDLKIQLAAKSKALEAAETNREAAERRLAAFEAKRGQRDLNWEEKYTELSITHTQTINERDAVLARAQEKIAAKDTVAKESVDREGKLNNEIADARHQVELLVYYSLYRRSLHIIFSFVCYDHSEPNWQLPMKQLIKHRLQNKIWLNVKHWYISH